MNGEIQRGEQVLAGGERSIVIDASGDSGTVRVVSYGDLNVEHDLDYKSALVESLRADAPIRKYVKEAIDPLDEKVAR